MRRIFFIKTRDLQPSRQEVIKIQANILTKPGTRERGILGMFWKWEGKSNTGRGERTAMVQNQTLGK